MPLLRVGCALALTAGLGAFLGACRERPAERPLTVLLISDILSLDPNEKAQAVTDSVLFNVYEPLVGQDENLNVRMLLAESYEHPSPERWRFRLRRGVRFHDGTSVDAAAVREALTSLRNAPLHEAALFLSQVRDIVAVSPDTLDIVTHEPRSILATLPFLYVTRKGKDGSLQGTGPYRVKGWQRGQHVDLERVPGYWGDPPEFPEVRFVPVPQPEERLRWLREGRADIAYGMTPEQAVAPAPGLRFIRRSGLTVFYLVMNLRARPGNPFSDIRVRRALHQALDREAMVRDGLQGTGAVATQPIAPFVFGYNPALPPPVRDLASARRLLAEAGLPEGFRTRLDYPSARHPFALHIRAQLAEVGIVVDLNSVATDDAYALAEKGESDFFLAGWDCSSGESSEFYEFCLHTPGKIYGFGNYGGYSNPALDEIAETNAAILDQRKRRSLLQEAARITMADLPVLPLYVEDDIYGVRDKVTFAPRADSEIRLLDIRRVTR